MQIQYRRHAAALWFACLVDFGGLVNAAPAPTPPPAWPIAWHVEGQRDHPLVGRIWQPATQSWVSPDEFRGALAKAHFAVLGETHDNPDHHRLQAEWLQVVVDAGRRPALAFEMLDVGQQPAVDEFLRGHPVSAAGLGAAVAWDKSGWPPWSYYQPIAQVALDHDLPIFAANLPTDEVKSAALKGFGSLGAETVAKLGLDQPLPQPWPEVMREELYKGHCELVPKPALNGMIDAQRARNAIMASRARDAAGPDGAVLIVGAGHARTDFGVPMILRQSAPAASVLSVAMVEVQAGRDQPSDYAREYSVDKLPFDYVVFTPRAKREDPCVALRAKMHPAGDPKD